MSSSQPEMPLRSGERYQQELEAKNKRRQKITLISVAIIGVVAVLAMVSILVFQRPPAPEIPQETPKLKLSDVDFLLSPEAFTTGAAIAEFAGVAILESDITSMMGEIFGRTTDLPASARDQALQRIKARILFAKEAQKSGYGSDELILAAFRRFYVRTLAARYLAEQLKWEVNLSVEEVNAYISENADLYGDRKRISVDAVDLARADAELLETEDLTSAPTMDALIDYIKLRDFTYRRRPFAVFSEELPKNLRDALINAPDSKTNFFIRNEETVSIIRILAIDDAPIPLADRFPLAKSKLTEIRRAEKLATLEQKLIADLSEGAPAKSGDVVETPKDDP